jgi:signal transduction histidine kinase
MRLEQAPRGTSQTSRVMLLDASGSSAAEVRLSATAIAHDGRPAVLASVSDETARQRIEEELRRSEARLDAILESVSDGLLVLGPSIDGPVVRMTNRAFLSLFDLGGADVLGSRWDDLAAKLRATGEHGRAVTAIVESGTAEPRSASVEVPGPEPRFLDIAGTPFADRSGAVLGRILRVRDLTALKVAERQRGVESDAMRRDRDALEENVRRAVAVTEDLRHRLEHQEELNRQLQKLDQMKSNLLANVTHELQTPLVSIRGYTEMILRERLGSLNHEQKEGLGLSLKNIDRLIGMIDDLTTFSRLNREATELTITSFSLRELIEESQATLRDKLEARRIALSVSLASGDVFIQADREKIYRVFLNLLHNAVKFNREGGRIEILAQRGRPDHAVVQVRDTGIGIPEEDLERVFQSGYQVPTGDRSRGSGGGLGLAIVRNILRLHGCSIRAESRVGQGTTFTFTLPLSVDEAATDRPTPPVTVVSSPADSQPSPLGAPDSEPNGDGPDGSSDAGHVSGRTRFRIIRR